MKKVKMLAICILIFLMKMTACNTYNEKSSDIKKENETDQGINIERKISRPRLEISKSITSDTISADIEYSAGKEISRVAEIFVSYTNESNYKNFEKKSALVRSEKNLIVQKLEPGLLRIIILSSENANPIQSGILLSLFFEKISDKPGKIEILTEQPIFAPSEANEGLLVGDPIEI